MSFCLFFILSLCDVFVKCFYLTCKSTFKGILICSPTSQNHINHITISTSGIHQRFAKSQPLHTVLKHGASVQLVQILLVIYSFEICNRTISYHFSFSSIHRKIYFLRLKVRSLDLDKNVIPHFEVKRFRRGQYHRNNQAAFLS